jgi:hypothetical protein
MNEKEQADNLAEEFRNLGKNLSDAMQAAWGSPERKKFQEEIEAGLADLSAAFKRESEAFRESPTGQRLKSDIEGVRQKVGSGEVQSRTRDELIAFLKRANAELEQVIARWTGQSAGRSENNPEGEDRETK